MRELARDTGFHVAHAYEHCQHEFEVAKDHVRYGEGEKLKLRSVEALPSQFKGSYKDEE